MDITIDIKAIVGSYLQFTLFVLMLSVGLSTGFSKVLVLARKPALLGRCVLAAYVLVPLAAMLINRVVPMGFPLRIGLATMAICAGAPMIYRKALKGRAIPELAASYQVTMCLLAVVFVPIWLAVFSKVYPETGSMPVAAILKQVAVAQLLPIGLGLVLRQWFTSLADELKEPVTKLGNSLLIGILVLLVVAVLPKALSVGVAGIVGAIFFATACVVIGHVLGGPDPESRLTIAVSNGTRNAGLALAVASSNFKDPGILGAIGAYALFAALVTAVYSKLCEKKIAPNRKPSEGDLAEAPAS